MSDMLGPPGAQLRPEQADNFEDIEKQFAVKGTIAATFTRPAGQS